MFNILVVWIVSAMDTDWVDLTWRDLYKLRLLHIHASGEKLNKMLSIDLSYFPKQQSCCTEAH